MNDIVAICLAILHVALSFQIKKFLYGKSIPLHDKRLDAVPSQKFENVTTVIQCASLCGNNECKAFNYDKSICELLDTFLCDVTTAHVLVSASNYKYYDVEYTQNDIYSFHDTEDCILYGRCSPKCFATFSTTSMIEASTTTEQTSLATTTLETTTMVTTTISANTLPINNPCSSSADCTVTNSECRASICQCEPGYSLRIYSNTVNCVTSCDVGLSNENNADGFTETDGYWLNDFPPLAISTAASTTDCIQLCIDNIPVCLSVSYVSSTSYCYVSGNTKYSAASSAWKSDSSASYFQRNCQKM